MKVAPILICRTKYVDYQNPVYCAPSDLSDSIKKSLHDKIVNPNNLQMSKNNECKIFKSDRHHVLIGKVLYVKDLDGDFDLSLDGCNSTRKAWGFIGGVLSRTDYVSSHKILDLPKQYYLQAYKECLYDEHWKDEKFQGVDTVKVFDVEMDELPFPDTTFCVEEIPIYPTSMDDQLFRYAAKQTIDEDKDVAFCSNAIYNASEALVSGALTCATVNERNRNVQIESYKKKLYEAAKAKQEEEDAKRRKRNEAERAKKHGREDNYEQKDDRWEEFIEELRRLCDKYGYDYDISEKSCDIYGKLKEGVRIFRKKIRFRL